MPELMLKQVGANGGNNIGIVADIIFVHGLGGSAQSTWTAQHGAYWPQWIFEDFCNTATPCVVWTLDFPADATRWTGEGDAMALPDRAGSVLEYLVNKGIGKRPIIFVAPSLGGLLVKSLLKVGSETGRECDQQLVHRTCGVVFIATPHRGSHLATLAEGLRLVMATVATRDLVLHSAYLNEVDTWYRNHVEKLEISTLAFKENRKLRKWGKRFWVVDPSSADPNIPGSRVISVDANHFEISKVSSRESAVYIDTHKFLKELLQITPKPTQHDLVNFLGGIAKDEDRCFCVLSSFTD